MNKPWQLLLLTVVVGLTAFLAGPKIWPTGQDVLMPPPNLLPGYIAVSAVEALAFGFAVAFAAFGWSAIRDVPLGARWLNKLLFVTLCWFMGNWWFHDNLHMHVGLDMNRLLYVELFFHMSMLACAVTLALSLMRFTRHAAAGKSA